jgi:hypothetical protein
MRIVVPIVQAKNNRGIDDLLDMLKDIFPFAVMEAYIIDTDNPGMAAVAEALAAKSGVETKGMTIIGGNGNGAAKKALGEVKPERTLEGPTKPKAEKKPAQAERRTCIECGSEYTNVRYANCCSYKCREARDKRKKATKREIPEV